MRTTPLLLALLVFGMTIAVAAPAAATHKPFHHCENCTYSPVAWVSWLYWCAKTRFTDPDCSLG